jgi:hypothetical protein
MICREVKTISALEGSSNIAYKVVKLQSLQFPRRIKEFGVVQVLNTKIHF